MELLLTFLFGIAVGLAVMYALCDLWWAAQEQRGYGQLLRRP